MKKPVRLIASAVLTLFLVFTISSCTEGSEPATAGAEHTHDMSAAKAEIVAANKEFSAFLAAKDSVGLAGLYSNDTKFMMNGAPAVSGRKNIQSALSGIMNSGITRVDLTTVEVWGTENLLTEEGELTLYVGDNEVDKGKYLVLWKKEDGNWRLFRDIFNSDLPAN